MSEEECWYIDPSYYDDGKSIDKEFYSKVIDIIVNETLLGNKSAKVFGDTFSISQEMKRTLKKIEDQGHKISYGPRYFKFEW